MNAKKIQPSELDQAIALVAPFVCCDPARMHMNSAFHAGLWGRPYVAATDGHTAALVYCPGASSDTVVRPFGAERPPPMDVVMPADADRVGEFQTGELEALDEIPHNWNAFVHFVPGQPPRLNARREKGPKGKRRTIKIVTGAALDFKNTLDVSTAISVGYLLRALEFCAVGLVTVHRDRRDDLAPLLFSTGSDGYKQAARVAIVMPCRA